MVLRSCRRGSGPRRLKGPHDSGHEEAPVSKVGHSRSVSQTRARIDPANGSISRMLAFLMCGKRYQIMRHLVIARVHRFVIHREHEDAVEVSLHDFLETGHGLAVNMTGLALRRREGLGLE